VRGLTERITDTAPGAVGLYQHRFTRPPGKELPSLAVAQNATFGVKPTTSVLTQIADQNEPSACSHLECLVVLGDSHGFARTV
jgi:hypothetical protein